MIQQVEKNNSSDAILKDQFNVTRDIRIIQEVWSQATSEAGLCSEQTPFVLRNLLEIYSNPARKYHSISFLKDSFAELERIKSTLENFPACVFATAFYSSVSGCLSRDEPEQRIYQLRCALIRLKAGDELVENGSCLVRALATDSRDFQTNDSMLLANIYRSVYAREPIGYARYARGLREECSRIPDKAYKEQRIDELTSLIRHDKLYYFEEPDSDISTKARGNIASELSILNNFPRTNFFDWKQIEARDPSYMTTTKISNENGKK